MRVAQERIEYRGGGQRGCQNREHMICMRGHFIVRRCGRSKVPGSKIMHQRSRGDSKYDHRQQRHQNNLAYRSLLMPSVGGGSYQSADQMMNYKLASFIQRFIFPQHLLLFF